MERLLGETGEFPPNYRSGWSNVRFYKIPEGVLKEGKNTIYINTYYNAENWISAPIKIIEYEKGRKEKKKNNYISYF